jgi:hypothetical protein
MSENKSQNKKGGTPGKVTANAVPAPHVFAEELQLAERVLKEAIDQQKTGLAGLEVLRYPLLHTISRVMRMKEKIDMAFGAQPFLPDLAGTDPINVQRSSTFFEFHWRCDQLLFEAMEAWVLTCGVRWECNSRTCAAANCPQRSKLREPRKRRRRFSYAKS